jgi:hypothetical protein
MIWSRTPADRTYHARRSPQTHQAVCGQRAQRWYDLPSDALRPDTLPYCPACQEKTRDH